MREAGRSQGSLTVELIILIPVVFLFILLALAMGRFELAREEIVSAARAGAEAAAVVPVPGDAQAAALQAVDPVVDGQSCSQLTVAADTAEFVPGGSVRVTVSCQISFSDLLVPGFSGRAAIQAAVSAPIDPLRALP